MDRYYITYDKYFDYCVKDRETDKIIFAPCGDIAECNKKCIELNSLRSIKDIIDYGSDGDYLAICKSGKKYDAKYSTKYRAMFFAIPNYEYILGYEKIINK